MLRGNVEEEYSNKTRSATCGSVITVQVGSVVVFLEAQMCLTSTGLPAVDDPTRRDALSYVLHTRDAQGSPSGIEVGRRSPRPLQRPARCRHQLYCSYASSKTLVSYALGSSALLLPWHTAANSSPTRRARSFRPSKPTSYVASNLASSSTTSTLSLQRPKPSLTAPTSSIATPRSQLKRSRNTPLRALREKLRTL